MKINTLLTAVLLSLGTFPIFSQYTITKGKNTIEISASVSMFYNHRILKEGETDGRKNRFNLRDAQIQLEGIHGRNIEYKIQFDVADMIAGVNDPENPGLMDAWVQYKAFKGFNIQIGYGTLPYSRSSLTPFLQSPYWQRPELTRGSLFSRRDVGITLTKSLWNQQINLYGGVYTGQGEISLKGDNDPSGQPEYMGRFDISYPSRYRFRDVDLRHVPVPMFTIGANIRYANKRLPDGTVMPAGSVGEYGIKTINGEKFTYGFDAAFQFKGFSAQFEMHQIKGRPHNANDPLLYGLPFSETGGVFYAGGWYSQISYYIKPIKTTLSARFEELDLSDLIKGNAQRLVFAAAYYFKGPQNCIKMQFWHNLREESIDPQRWNQQLRIGYQYAFQ